MGGEDPQYVTGVDCRYCADESVIKQEMADLQKGGPPNTESLGTLFLEFLRYYAHVYRGGAKKHTKHLGVQTVCGESCSNTVRFGRCD
eukprot:3357376-Amphidinium_carterae.1